VDYQKFLEGCRAAGKGSQQSLKSPLRTKRSSNNEGKGGCQRCRMVSLSPDVHFLFSSHELSYDTLKSRSLNVEDSIFRSMSFGLKAG